MALSSTKHSFIIIFFFFLFLSLQHTTAAPPNANFLKSSCLRVSPSKFVDSTREVITILDQLTSTLSRFTKIFGNSRLSNAIIDCLDLIDISSEVLTWTASAAQNPQGKGNSTGSLSSDLRTWLSAVMANPETCMEGLEGTNTIVKRFTSSGLGKVTTMVINLLDQVVPPSSDEFTTDTAEGEYPSWAKEKDMKLQVNGVNADAVVATDGTGNYSTVMDAVLAAPDYSMKRYVIYVKRGIYKEYVDIKKKKWNIMIVGEGMDSTIISGDRNYVDGLTTYRTATFAVSGRGFIARDIAFQNTAGPEKHQAVALRSDSDLSVFYRCGIFGYQDSLYPHSMRQFYRECKITGTVDFIFGDAIAVFQNCEIKARKGLPTQKNTITAQGRIDPRESSGFSFQFCNISADSDLLPFVSTIETYLGRPWKNYSRTVFMQSSISDIIRPEGWLPWNKNAFLDTLYYAEYMNSGPGAGLSNRVKWPGYHVFNDSNLANKFTVDKFLDGKIWLPPTGITFTAGLTD